MVRGTVRVAALICSNEVLLNSDVYSSSGNITVDANADSTTGSATGNQLRIAGNRTVFAAGGQCPPSYNPDPTPTPTPNPPSCNYDSHPDPTPVLVITLITTTRWPLLTALLLTLTLDTQD